MEPLWRGFFRPQFSQYRAVVQPMWNCGHCIVLAVIECLQRCSEWVLVLQTATTDTNIIMLHSDNCVKTENTLHHSVTALYYQALVQSVLLYAAETWTPLATDIKALEAFHMNCQRQLLQISRQQFIRNDEVAATTGLPSISEIIRRRRSTLFGHVARLPQDVPAHKALHCHVDLSTSGNATWADPESDGSTRSERTRDPPGGPVEACVYSWSPRSNATALAGYAITTTTTVQMLPSSSLLLLLLDAKQLSNSKGHHPVRSHHRSSDGAEWSCVAGLKLRCAGRERYCPRHGQR